MKFDKSKAAWEAGTAYVAGGVNSGYRTGLRPHPLVFQKAYDAHLVDLDGNDFIDYFLGMGPMILGHSPKEVVAAATKRHKSTGSQVRCWQRRRFHTSGQVLSKFSRQQGLGPDQKL